MKKLLTKLSAFIVALALIMSSMTTVFAKSIADHFTVTDNIKVGETKTVTIENSFDVSGQKTVYYKFVPSETDVYVLNFNKSGNFGLGCKILSADFTPLDCKNYSDTYIFYATGGKTYHFSLCVTADNSTFSMQLGKLVSNADNVLKSDKTATINADKSGTVYYKFIPTETAFYEIFSDCDGDLDPKATVYDSRFNEINSDDDGLKDYNFSLRFKGIAGKVYYVAFNTYLSDDAYKVTVNKFSVDTFTEIKPNETNVFKINNYNEIVYYAFTPTETGSCKLFSDSSNSSDIDPGVLLYDDDFIMIDENDDDNGWDFQLDFTVLAGKTYYIGIYGREVDAEFDFTLEYTEYDEIKSGDTKTVNVEESYKVYCYKFTPTETARYNLASDCGDGDVSDIDPYVTVYDSKFKSICESDDIDSDDNNFELGFMAFAGETYYIGVYGRESETQFDFSLELINDVELKLDEAQNVEIQNDEYLYYKFIPEESGCYVVVSDCGDEADDIDPRVSLYDEKFNILGDNDDRGSNDYEFEFEYKLEAGKTYYYEIDARRNNLQFNFSLKKHYCFTHQPTSSEPYVDFGWNAAEDYQWYNVLLPETEITDKNSTVVESEDYKSTYTQSDGWTTEYNGYQWTPFNIELEKGEKIVLETNDQFLVAEIKILSDEVGDYIGDYIYYNGCSLYELTAPETATYAFSLYECKSGVKFKVYKGDLDYKQIDGQNTNTITKYTLGENYVCEVTVNGATDISNIIKLKNAIIHQPTENELYVKTNSEDVVKYQWYYAKQTEIELTDKNTEAVVSLYDSEPATYNTTIGWSGQRVVFINEDGGHYKVEDIGGSVCFKVKLEKGEEVKFVIDGELNSIVLSSADGEYYAVVNIYGEETATITATADGEYYVMAYGKYDAYFKAYKTIGYEYTKIDGETSSKLKNVELGKTYACEVTYTDGTKEMSNVAKTSGWQIDASGWWYQYADGSYATGWALIGGNWYYFSADGYMQTGWQSISGTWYYFNTSGDMVSNAWVGGYYLSPSGAMTTPTWQQDSNGWWYSYGDGNYATGWASIGGSWYYFSADGYMQTGWQLIGGTWYYFYSGGQMATSTWIGNDYVTASGAMGYNSWQLDGNGWWYRYADGTYPTNTWAVIDGSWYYFNASGYAVTGWQVIGGSWYYFYSGGQMASNCYVGDYWLTVSGAMA